MILLNKKKFNKFNSGDLVKYYYVYDSLPAKYSKGDVRFGIIIDIKNIKEDITLKVLNSFKVDIISSISNVYIDIVS